MNSINLTSKEQSNLLYNPSIFDYLELMKPKVMSLVIFTTLVGMYLAPNHIHPVLSFFSIVAIALGAGSAGAMNQWIDQDVDSVMLRTKERPIPSGRVDPAEAITFSLVVALISIIMLGLASNWFAASLLLFTIIFYSVIYSIILKRKTPQNIVIGGAAGSLPPVIGWVSMTGNISLFPIIMFMIIFLWTPPHFWALALVKSEDYQRARIPMMPNVVGKISTKKQILCYSILVLLFSISPYYLELAGILYLLSAIFLNLIFISFSVGIMIFPNKKLEIPLFVYSILYLFGIFAFLVFDKYFFGPTI